MEYAVQQANDFNLPLIVAFGLTSAYPEANGRSNRRRHNSLRRYWGKKVLEWSAKPQDTVLVQLNKYEADGRNANSYAGTNWGY